MQCLEIEANDLTLQADVSTKQKYTPIKCPIKFQGLQKTKGRSKKKTQKQ